MKSAFPPCQTPVTRFAGRWVHVPLMIPAIIVSLVWCISQTPGAETPTNDSGRQTVELISSMGSERATVGPGNLIVTYEGRTHVVWQDATPQGYFNRIRTLERKTGAWSETVTLGRVVDNHARPVINVDHKGFLHVILGGHNTAVTYRRSLRPNDSSEWSKPEPAGEGTYAVMICGADDTLYLTMRAKNHGGLDLYIRPPAGNWQAPVRLIGKPKEYSGYAGYINAMAWGANGTLHMVSDFLRGPCTRNASRHASGRVLHAQPRCW